MSDETYNGWKNYPTWAVHLWLTNEQSSYDECVRTAGDAIRHDEHPRVYMADALKESLEQDLETETTFVGVFADLVGFALDQVDWFAIADAFLADGSLDDLKARVA